MSNPRIAVVIGCGKAVDGKEGWAIGHAHADGWRKADPDIRLCGVDPNPENLRAFGDRFGLASGDLFASTEAMYQAVQPDYVSIATWPGLHAPQVLEAVDRGVKGILCEKPLATSPGEIREIREAIAKSGTKISVAHQRVFSPKYKAVRDALKAGVIGDKVVAEFRVGDDWDILSWTVHWFDIATYLFDAKPVSVLAGMDVSGEKRYGQAVENRSVIFVEYDGGQQAIFITGPTGQNGETNYLRGSEGFLVIKDQPELYTRNGFRLLETTASGEPEGFGGAALELIRAVEEGKPMLLDIDRSADSTLIAYAAHESSRTSRTVKMPLDFEYAPLELAHQVPTPALPYRKAVLFADEHFGSKGKEGIAEALAAIMGEPPKVIDATQGLRSEDLQDAEILMIYHTQSDADEATRQVLSDWVQSGKPLLMLHCATGAYPEWEEFKQWAGRVWVWSGPNASEHPIVESTLHVLDGVKWPWRSAWLPKDEVFIKLGATAEVEELLTVDIPDGTFPAAWRSKTHRNIATWIPGHRGDLWRSPAMRDGLIEMMRLLAD